MRYRLTVTGLGDVIQEIERVTKEIDVQARRALYKVAKRVEFDARKAVPVDVGLLRTSIVAEKWEGESDSVEYRIGVFDEAALKYAPPVEFGTGPRTSPSSWPPLKPLERWVSRKFGLPAGSKEAKRAAFLVRRKIIRHGTSPKPFLRPAFATAPEELAEEMRKLR